jgi:hypothetical protein
VLDEILAEVAATSRTRRNHRGVKRKMSNFPVRRGYQRLPRLAIRSAIKIVTGRVLGLVSILVT